LTSQFSTQKKMLMQQHDSPTGFRLESMIELALPNVVRNASCYAALLATASTPLRHTESYFAST